MAAVTPYDDPEFGPVSGHPYEPDTGASGSGPGPEVTSQPSYPSPSTPTPTPTPTSGGAVPFSMDAFRNVIGQIDPRNWENDYARFQSQFDAWGVKPQRGSSGQGAFRGRFMLPGMSGYDWDPWQNGLGWGLASYDPRVTGEAVGGGGQSAPPTTPANPNAVFNDPATVQWEKLLRDAVAAMHVQQPTWTPSQLETQQTQILDPMMQQQDAEIQQAIEWGARHGQQPNSGPVLQRIDDVKRRYSVLRTQAQSQIANQSIQRDDALFRNNEQRQVNAVNLMRQIPQLADSRLQLAMQSMMNANPQSLLNVQQQYSQQAQQNSQYQQQQDAQFWAQMAQLIADAVR